MVLILLVWFVMSKLPEVKSRVSMPADMRVCLRFSRWMVSLIPSS